MSIVNAKDEFFRDTRRILKTRLPNEAVDQARLRTTVIKYNEIRARCSAAILLDKSSNTGRFAEAIFRDCKRRLARVCFKLAVYPIIPNDHRIPVDLGKRLAPGEIYNIQIGSDTDEESEAGEDSEDSRSVSEHSQRHTSSSSPSEADENSDNSGGARPFSVPLVTPQETDSDSEHSRPPSVPSQGYTPPITPPLNPPPEIMDYNFVRFVNETLTAFDATYENHARFRNQINIIRTGVNAGNLALTLELIKAKITRETVVTRLANVATIDELLEAVNGQIKRPEPHMVVEKLRAIKHTEKNTLKLTNELKETADELMNAYLSSGVAIDTATKFTTNNLKEILSEKATNDNVRNAMKTNNYTTVEQLLDVVIRNGPKSEAFIGAMRRSGASRRRFDDNYGYRHNHRGKGKGRSFRGRGNFRGNSKGNFRGNFRGNNYRGRGNYDGKRGRGHYNNNNKPRKTYKIEEEIEYESKSYSGN